MEACAEAMIEATEPLPAASTKTMISAGVRACGPV